MRMTSYLAVLLLAAQCSGWASGNHLKSTLASQSNLNRPQVETFWTAPGQSQKELPDGSLETQLGHGISRINWPGGHSQLHGIAYLGKTVTYELEGDNELWHFDLKELAEKMKANAKNDRCVLTLGDGREINIYSEHRLSIPQLKNMAWVISLAPRNTFTSGDFNETFFVVDELGEVRVTGGPFLPLGGLHDTASKTIFIRAHELDSYATTAFILRHEIGHDIDARYGWLSRALAGKDGKLLFGSGTLVLDAHGQVELKKSAFESQYASSNSQEDFAETHEFLLRFREFYVRNQGHDLFSLTPVELRAELSKHGISPILQEKMMAIVDHVYASAGTAVDFFPPLQSLSLATAASPGNR